jgi:hypothetical protein
VVAVSIEDRFSLGLKSLILYEGEFLVPGLHFLPLFREEANIKQTKLGDKQPGLLESEEIDI